MKSHLERKRVWSFFCLCTAVLQNFTSLTRGAARVKTKTSKLFTLTFFNWFFFIWSNLLENFPKKSGVLMCERSVCKVRESLQAGSGCGIYLASVCFAFQKCLNPPSPTSTTRPLSSKPNRVSGVERVRLTQKISHCKVHVWTASSWTCQALHILHYLESFRSSCVEDAVFSWINEKKAPNCESTNAAWEKWSHLRVFSWQLFQLSCCALGLFLQASHVSSLPFLWEQNKEVHTLLSSCEMECWLHAVHWGEVV